MSSNALIDTVRAKARAELARREALDRLKGQCEASLYTFVRTFWHIVEPANPMVDGLAMFAICQHLEAVTVGDVTRLIINVPPGFSKSLITDVFWPAWEWGPRRMPHLRYVAFCYSAHLTERDNDRCMRLMTSAEYQRLWGDVVRLVKVGVTQIMTNRTGWKLATSITGVGTGERGDRLLLDDMNDVRTAESEVVRQATNRWLREVMPSRLNQPTSSAIVNIQQRTHEEDATGTLIQIWDNPCWLMLPMRYEPDRHCVTSIGWEDWRTEPGELAWPERFPESAVEALERSLGEYATAGQLQQSPQPRGGGLIKREWWQPWETSEVVNGERQKRSSYPPFEYILVQVDPSSSMRESADPRAATVWGLWRDEFATPRVTWRDGTGAERETRTGFLGAPRLMLLYAWQGRLTLHEFVLKLIEIATTFKADRVRVEGTSNGISVVQEMQRVLRGELSCVVDCETLPVGMDKFARLQSVQHIWQEGLISAPADVLEDGTLAFKAWADMVIDQVSAFPRGAHDDLADTCSSAVRFLRDMNMALLGKEHVEAETGLARLRPASSRKALYPV